MALGITSFFSDVGSEMIFPLLPVFVASLGASPTFLGLVEGLADATSSLLKLLSGRLSDHTRRHKPWVLLGYSVAALVRPLMALATLPGHVLAVRMTDRVGKGLRTAPRDALIANAVTPEESGRAFGFQRALDHAGAVLGPLIATTLLSLGWPIRQVFWAAVIPGVLSMVAVMIIREPPPPVPLQVEASPSGSAPLPGSFKAWLVILFLFCLGNSSDAFLLLRARDLGVPMASLPLLWAMLHIAKGVSAYAFGDWSDRVSRFQLIAAGWGIFAGTYLAFGVATQVWQAWVLFLLYGLYYGLTEPAERAVVRDLVPQEKRGTAYGAYHFVMGVSAIPGGLLTGWLWQTYSSTLALTVGATLAGTAAVALVVWDRITARQKLAP